MAPPSRLDDALTEAVAADLKRGASFAFVARRHGIPDSTSRYWLARGRMELAELAKDGAVPNDTTTMSPFAWFARECDAAMGEAVLDAAARVWRDNPSLWLRWSYARNHYYPLEAKLNTVVQDQEKQEALSEAKARKQAVLAQHPLPATPPADEAAQWDLLYARGEWLDRHGITRADVFGSPDDNALAVYETGSETPVAPRAAAERAPSERARAG